MVEHAHARPRLERGHALVAPPDRRAQRGAVDADLALGHQVLQQRPHVVALHRVHPRVVELVDVDPVGLEALQGLLEVRPQERRVPVVGPLAVPGPVVLDEDVVAELRGDGDLVALRAQRLRQQPVGAALRVRVGGVEQGDAGVEARADQLDGAIVGDVAPPARGYGPQAEADLRRGHVAVAERPVTHPPILWTPPGRVGRVRIGLVAHSAAGWPPASGRGVPGRGRPDLRRPGLLRLAAARDPRGGPLASPTRRSTASTRPAAGPRTARSARHIIPALLGPGRRPGARGRERRGDVGLPARVAAARRGSVPGGAVARRGTGWRCSPTSRRGRATPWPATALDRYFSLYSISEELGYEKPDPRIFAHAVDQAGVEPARAVMVGDRLDNDVRPAQAAGMRGVWLLRGEAPEDPTPEQAAEPDAVIRSLAELPGGPRGASTADPRLQRAARSGPRAGSRPPKFGSSKSCSAPSGRQPMAS